MNSVEFLNEVINSGQCPSDFEKIYNEFQSFQLDALKTLKEFHRVCELNDVPYMLFYGSLLGVIRDHGQIPWDYDIDVIVAYEDKEKLIKALNKDLDNKYYYYCPDNNPKCRHMLMRLAPIEYRTEALHVDVFFLTGAPDNEEERKKFAKRIKELSNIRYGKLVNIKEEALGNPRRFFRLLIKEKIPTLIFSLNKLNKEYEQLCSKYRAKDANVCIHADTFAEFRNFPSELLWQTQLITTNFGEIRIPIYYHELLELVYGKYMEIPPIERRIHEVMYNYHRIDSYSKKDKGKGLKKMHI